MAFYLTSLTTENKNSNKLSKRVWFGFLHALQLSPPWARLEVNCFVLCFFENEIVIINLI